MHRRINPSQYCIHLISSIVFLMLMLLTLYSTGGKLAKAQTGEVDWSQPLNLSQSGASSNPVMVMDANNVFHVIWQDKINGTMYTKREGGNWSVPSQVKMQFRENNPALVADLKGIIHVFWRDENNRLFYSRVASSDFASTKWGAQSSC